MVGREGYELLKYQILLQPQFPRGLGTHLPVVVCDNSIGISKSVSNGSMVLLGGEVCGLHLAGMCLTLVTGSLSNLVCFLGLKALLSGISVSAM